MESIIYDANGAIAGRLASTIAKQLLTGNSVQVVNVEGAIISGNPRTTVAGYAVRRTLHNKGDPEHSVKWSRRPDYLFKRIVKGMLPPHSARRKNALSLLRVHMGVPKELAGKSADAKTGHKSIPISFITFKELAVALGWHN